MPKSSNNDRIPFFSPLLSTAITVRELFAALIGRRMGAMIPILSALLVLGVGLYVLHVISPLAPFVYSLF